MNYIFIGGTYRGYKVLQELLVKGYVPDHIVILKEDEHETMKYSSELVKVSGELKISYSLRKKLGKDDIEIIKNKKRDFCIVCGWRTIIPTELNRYFKLGMIAAHDSLLPKYRGFAPLNWAIINGEKETGVSLFIINDGEVDSGKIIDQIRVKINKNEFAWDVYKKITQATIQVYCRFILNYTGKNIILKDQDEKHASYTCKRIPEDGKINWGKTSSEIYNLIRALAYPYSGAFCYHNSKKYIIRKAKPGLYNSKIFIGNIPGRVIKICKEGVEVLCSKGTILLSEWEDADNGQITNPSDTIKSISISLK